MMQTQSLTAVQQRIARHYLDTLRRANTAIQRGHGNRAYWNHQIEQDWEQIRSWQSWAANAPEGDTERSRLCVDFSIEGFELLRVRQTPAERMEWLQQAIAAMDASGEEHSTVKRTLIYELGHTYFLIGDTQNAQDMSRKLLDIAEQSGDTFNIGRAWFVLGQVGLHMSAIKEAESAMQKAASLLEKVGAEAEYGRALQGLGRAAMYQGQGERAYDLFARYLSIVEKSNREAELAPAYLTMNHVLLQLRRYGEAKQYAERALDVCVRTGFQRMLPNVYLSLAASEAELDELDAAYSHYQAGIPQAKLMRSNSTLIDMLRLLADVEMRQGNYPDAYEHLQESLSLSREYNILYYLCEITAALTRWHVDQGEAAPARTWLREALGFAQQLKSENFLCITLTPAVMLWRLDGQLEQATVWAGALMNHPEHTPPRLFDPLRERLEKEIGTEAYQRAIERGKTLTLETAVEQAMALLGNAGSS